MAKQVDLGDPEVGSQRLDVLCHPVAAVGRRVGWYGRGTGPPRFEEDEPALCPPPESAKVTEVVGAASRASGQAGQGRTLAYLAIRKDGAIVGGEGSCH